jgi:hypothetical protein
MDRPWPLFPRMSAHPRRAPADRDSRPDTSPGRYRTLVWEGSVPIQVSLDEGELPQGSDRSVESYFVRRRAPGNETPLLC